MSRLTPAAATLAAACLLATHAAHAAPTTAFTGAYTITLTPGIGGAAAEPTITDDGNQHGSDGKTLSSPFTELVGTTLTAAIPFFSATPSATCTATCTGGRNGITTATITVAFTLTSPAGATGNLTATALYTADYANQTDSITWTSPDPLVATFANGTVLDITLNNAEDWTITPTIQFRDPPARVSVPEPASLTLFAAALLAATLTRRRRAGPTAPDRARVTPRP